MAEDQSQQADETAAGTGAGSEGSEPDYKALYEKAQSDLERAKANSRKWEDRSKANADKARAFDASQEKAKTVEERLAALERENAGLRAARDRAALVESVSRATGLELNDPAVWQGRSTDTDFFPGSFIESEFVFAGAGSKNGKELRVRYRLAEMYGGEPEDWSHVSGVGWVFDPDYNGRIRRAEVHWMENPEAGVHEVYWKRWRDEDQG